MGDAKRKAERRAERRASRANNLPVPVNDATAYPGAVTEEGVSAWMVGKDETRFEAIVEESAEGAYVNSGWGLVDKHFSVSGPLIVLGAVVVLVWLGLLGWLFIQDNGAGRLESPEGFTRFYKKAEIASVGCLVGGLLLLAIGLAVRKGRAATSAMILLACAAALSACAVPAPKDGDTVRLIDSATVAPGWDLMTDSMTIFRYAVGQRDTLTDVLPPRPIATDDSTVWGVRADRAKGERRLFRYISTSRRLDVWSMPPDIIGGYTDVMISPRGDMVAYVAINSHGLPSAVVRQLPDGPVVVQGSTVGGCDCDVDLNHARWISPDSVEIAVSSTADQKGWAISAGNPKAGRIRTFYVPTEPDWHVKKP